jgi:hypothetical protein
MGGRGAAKWSAALGVALAAAGCGGGSTLSPDEYTQRLNDACTAHRERVKALGEPSLAAFVRPVAELTVLSDASNDELAAVFERARPLERARPKLLESVEQMNDDTADLRPSRDNQDVFDAAEEWPDFLRRLKLDLEWVGDGFDEHNALKIHSASSSLLGDVVDAHYLIGRIGAPACTPEPL